MEVVEGIWPQPFSPFQFHLYSTASTLHASSTTAPLWLFLLCLWLCSSTWTPIRWKANRVERGFKWMIGAWKRAAARSEGERVETRNLMLQSLCWHIYRVYCSQSLKSLTKRLITLSLLSLFVVTQSTFYNFCGHKMPRMINIRLWDFLCKRSWTRWLLVRCERKGILGYCVHMR